MKAWTDQDGRVRHGSARRRPLREDQRRERMGIAAAICFAIALVWVAVGLAGCAVPDAAAERLRRRAAVADGIVRLWPEKDEVWRERSVRSLRRTLHAIVLELLGEWPTDAELVLELERLAEVTR